MDTKIDRLDDAHWKNIKNIIVFGYGRYGSRIVPYLRKSFHIVAIIDNDKNKKNIIVDGIKIMSAEEAENLLCSYKIIVTTQAFFYTQISNQLQEMGLVEHVDYTIWNQFFAEWYYKYRSMVCIEKADIPITSYCSLNCESCSAFIPYIKEKRHETLEQIERSVSLFFENVDRVQDMNLYGGEPFLHPQLCEIIEAVGKYREKMGYFGIITNGTIIPDMQVIELLKKYDMGISISDYSNAIDYKEKLDRLCKLFEEHQINVVRTVNMVWFDLGFPRKKIQYDRIGAQKHMVCCSTACHDLIDGKIYYCVADRAAQLGDLVPHSEKSYIDLTKINKNDLESRKAILELCAGNIEGGSLDFCKICGGFGCDNLDEIPAAKQIKMIAGENRRYE